MASWWPLHGSKLISGAFKSDISKIDSMIRAVLDDIVCVEKPTNLQMSVPISSCL